MNTIPTTPSTPEKIIYVAGYGRSGSTVLATILGGHSQIVSVGEVTTLPKEWSDPARFCSCGKSYAECEFWGDFYREWERTPDLINAIIAIERRSTIARLLTHPNSAKMRVYEDYHRALFEYVIRRSGKPIILDSSKSARLALGRFIALNRLTDVYVIHIIRNGWGVVHSIVVTGSNRAQETPGQVEKPATLLTVIRATLGWAIANIGVSLLGKLFFRERYMALRFEDLVAKPEAALRKIGAVAGFDPQPLIDQVRRVEEFDVGHQVGGNRLRFQGKVRLRASEDIEQLKKVLTPVQRAIFRIGGSWLNVVYGYRKRQNDPGQSASR